MRVEILENYLLYCVILAFLCNKIFNDNTLYMRHLEIVIIVGKEDWRVGNYVMLLSKNINYD